MTLLISVFDKKASEYEPPMAFPNLAQVLRAYSTMFVKNPEAQKVQFCDDFDLYLVGEFEEVTGAVTPTHPPQFLESMANLGFQVSKTRNGVAGKEVQNG